MILCSPNSTTENYFCNFAFFPTSNLLVMADGKWWIIFEIFHITIRTFCLAKKTRQIFLHFYLLKTRQIIFSFFRLWLRRRRCWGISNIPNAVFSTQEERIRHDQGKWSVKKLLPNIWHKWLCLYFATGSNKKILLCNPLKLPYSEF